MIHAAAYRETYFTVWTNLFQRGSLQKDDRALVDGGTSGIGTTAMQFARAFGAQVIATAGSDDKCAACERLGARAINYRTADFVTAVDDLTGGSGVDVILDIVGGSYLSRNLECLAKDGRLVQVGLQGGNKTEINLATLMQRRLTLTGSTLRPRTVAEKGLSPASSKRTCGRCWRTGRSSRWCTESFPWNAPPSHRALESGEVIGKIVLTM